MENKLYKFLEFINDFDCENGYKIIRIKSWNCYLVQRKLGNITLSERDTVSPVWDKKRIVGLFKKIGKFLFSGVTIFKNR